MIEKKRVLVDIISLMLLSLATISFIPSFISFEKLLTDVNYVVFSSVLVLSAFFIFFVTKKINVTAKGEKIIAVVMLFLFLIFALFSLFFFKNANDAWYPMYLRIKTLLPYLFIVSLFYTLDSIKEEESRFKAMLYLSSLYFIIGFLSLDLDGMILLCIADVIYSLVSLRKYTFKTLVFLSVFAFLIITSLLSSNMWTGYLKENSQFVFSNRNTDELFTHAKFLPDSYAYTTSGNYLVSLTNSFGLLGLSIGTILFVLLIILSITDGVCTPYWIFMSILYLLSFISLIFKAFNFEFYLFSPSLITITINAMILGVVAKKKEI